MARRECDDILNRESLKIFVKKGYCDLRVRTAAVSIMAFAWWGLLYPELCFTENTCIQVIVSQGQEIVSEQIDCREILSASGDEIVIRSRFMEWLEEKKSKK
ncbi:MAG: hypothetical protein NC416_11190 [Eubacterium sp.]|nr:hypothetical protein [Eubacterium sp.]